MGRYFRLVNLFSIMVVVLLISCTKKQSEIQVEEGLLEINGTELFYKRMGTGETILVVHGGPVLEHGYLSPWLQPLADEYELIFFDQRLSGRSSADVDSSEISLRYFVEDIEGVRKALSLDEIHLMGHSWGGLLAMNYAVKYPSNLKSLILLNAMPASSELWRQEEEILAGRMTDTNKEDRKAIMQTEAFQKREPTAIKQLLELSFRNQFFNSAMADSLDLYVPDDYMARSTRFQYVGRDLVSYDLHAQLDTLSIPTLIIYGETEPAVTLSGSKLDSLMPDSRFVVIEEAGHFPFIEQPQAFQRTVRTFLNKQES